VKVEADDVAVGSEENLGVPIEGLTSAGAGYTQDADGRNIGVVVAGGEPSQFSAVDIISGELLMSEAITGSAAAWAYETTPDRRVYIGAGGQVFVFDPDEMSLDLIAVQPEGQSSIWDMESGEDGTVYFGSYPDGKLLAYAPDTDEWTDYGQQVEGNQYV